MKNYKTYIPLVVLLGLIIAVMICFSNMTVKIIAGIAAVLCGGFLAYKMARAYKSDDRSKEAEHKRGEIFAMGVFLFIWLPPLYLLMTNSNKRDDVLKERGIITTAIVTDIYRAKHRHFDYQYDVGGTLYEDGAYYTAACEGVLFEGGTFLIVYDPLDPENSDFYVDDNERVVVIDRNGNEIHFPPYKEPLWMIVAGIALLAWIIVKPLVKRNKEI